MSSKINDKGLQLIKTFEGRRLVAYQDQAGIWTIGYGHTGPEVTKGLVWMPDQCEAQFLMDLEHRVYPLHDFISEGVNDNQWSALCSLTFNEGLARVKASKTLQLINQGQDPTVEWMGFNKVAGVVNPGLVRRRTAELELYHAIG